MHFNSFSDFIEIINFTCCHCKLSLYVLLCRPRNRKMEVWNVTSLEFNLWRRRYAYTLFILFFKKIFIVSTKDSIFGRFNSQAMSTGEWFRACERYGTNKNFDGCTKDRNRCFSKNKITLRSSSAKFSTLYAGKRNKWCFVWNAVGFLHILFLA